MDYFGSKSQIGLSLKLGANSFAPQTPANLPQWEFLGLATPLYKTSFFCQIRTVIEWKRCNNTNLYPNNRRRLSHMC